MLSIVIRKLLLRLRSPLMAEVRIAATTLGLLPVLSSGRIARSLDDLSLITDEVSHLHAVDATIGIAQGLFRLPDAAGSHSALVVRLHNARSTVRSARDLRDIHRADTEDFHTGSVAHHFVHHLVGETKERLEDVVLTVRVEWLN